MDVNLDAQMRLADLRARMDERDGQHGWRFVITGSRLALVRVGDRTLYAHLVDTGRDERGAYYDLAIGGAWVHRARVGEVAPVCGVCEDCQHRNHRPRCLVVTS